MHSFVNTVLGKVVDARCTSPSSGAVQAGPALVQMPVAEQQSVAECHMLGVQQMCVCNEGN